METEPALFSDEGGKTQSIGLVSRKIVHMSVALAGKGNQSLPANYMLLPPGYHQDVQKVRYPSFFLDSIVC